MSYLGMNAELARRLGQVVREASSGADGERQRILAALMTTDLDSHAPTLLAGLQDELATLGVSVTSRADRIDQFSLDELNAAPPSTTFLQLAQADFGTSSSDGLAGLFNRPPIVSVPGAAIASAPPGWPALESPYAGQDFRIAVLGDSFFSGEGFPGEGYKGLGPIVDGIQLSNPNHQHPDAGPLQAVRALQAQYPEAEVRITYTTASGRTEVIPPLVPTFNGGPVFHVTFAAESGADTRELLGLTSDNFPYGPSHSQLSAVTNQTDAVLLSIGGNNRINETDANGGFVSVLMNAMGPLDAPYLMTGADDIDRLTNGLPAALLPIKDVIGGISENAAPWAHIIYAGYPYFISPLNEHNVPLPLPGGELFPLSVFDSDSLGFPVNMIDDMESRSSARFWTMMTMLQENYAESVPLKPGQDLQFVEQDWYFNTLLSDRPAVHGYLGSGDQRSFHPNDLGQEMYRDALFPPLLDAVSDIMGPPRAEALSPFDSFGPMVEEDLWANAWEAPVEMYPAETYDFTDF